MIFFSGCIFWKFCAERFETTPIKKQLSLAFKFINTKKHKEAQIRKKLKHEANRAFQILNDNVDNKWKKMEQLENQRQRFADKKRN